MSRADVIILGAGAAGLSLAWKLVRRGLAGRRVVLIDPRTEHGRDRTWCFWDVVPHDFEDLVTHAWSAWRVRVEGGAWIERRAPGVLYQHLPSDRFYARVLDRLRATPSVELRLGERAGRVEERGREVCVETDRGAWVAPIVFDSRPPPRRGIRAPGRDVALLQHFEGWVVEAEGARFEPGVATLMDFAVPQDLGTQFVYTLPFSPTRALVEATFFDAQVLPPARYAEHLERYLRSSLGLASWTVRHRERGAIPMRTDGLEARPSARVYRIGLAGGAAKPSTGYAFQAIQRQAAAYAEALDREALPDPPAVRPWRSRFLDQVFLSYLSRHPTATPALLVGLFERVDPTTLVRFLSDTASPVECLAVMRAMPLAPMALETVRSAPLWLRG